MAGAPASRPRRQLAAVEALGHNPFYLAPLLPFIAIGPRELKLNRRVGPESASG